MTFGRTMRLTKAADFKAMYDANVRRSAGPLLIYIRSNGLAHPRLGMAVSARVGGAVTRNRIRRRLREAFRRSQHDLPQGYDFVISVRPHEALEMQEYQQLLLEAAKALHEKWTRKQDKAEFQSRHDSSSES